MRIKCKWPYLVGANGCGRWLEELRGPLAQYSANKKLISHFACPAFAYNGRTQKACFVGKCYSSNKWDEMLFSILWMWPIAKLVFNDILRKMFYKRRKTKLLLWIAIFGVYPFTSPVFMTLQINGSKVKLILLVENAI